MDIRHPFLSVTAVLFALALAACGGGGDGGQPSVTQTSPADAKSASAASRSAIGALNVSGSATNPSIARSLNATNESDARLIREGLDILKAHLKGERPTGVVMNNNVARSVVEIPGSSCTLGGSSSVSIDDKNTVDELDDTITTSYSNCRMSSSTVGRETLHSGSMSIAFLNQSNFNITFTNFEESEIDTASQKTVSYFKINGAMVSSGITLTPCQATGDQFMKGLITVNTANENREDLNKDGVYEINEVFTATNLKLDITEGFDSSTCAATTDTIVMNGAAKLDDKVKPTDNFTATFTNLAMTVKERKSGATITGDEMTVNGQVAISSSCATGTFTIATVTPLFSPTGKDCPEEGKMVVTGGGKSTAVIATSSGGINIDEDNNGSIEKSLPTCEDAEVCS